MATPSVNFRNIVLLAPMMRGGNPSMRLYAEKGCGSVGGGAAIQCGEMANAQWIREGNPRDIALITRRDETMFCPQLAGNDPEDLSFAAKRAAELGAMVIDFNVGCPKSFAQGNAIGAALLRRKHITLLGHLIEALKRSVDLPITVKTRGGWCPELSSPPIEEITKIVEAAGADAMTVHARFANQRYDVPADWTLIGRAVAVSRNMPIIGNGDIRNFRDVKRMKVETGCASVSIGRAALMRPWIFDEITKRRSIHLCPKHRVGEFNVIVNNLKRFYADSPRDQLELIRFHAGWMIAWYKDEMEYRARWKTYQPEDPDAIKKISGDVQKLIMAGPHNNPRISLDIFRRGDTSASKG